ncbi:MAG TPA: ATP-binding protein [bacterium]|nr:ATP-binding protein [bacterium]HQL62569.1 ATP-binding protein [bacterium]
MILKRVIPIVLTIFWLAVVAWQYLEHQRVVADGRTALRNRGRDIANTLAVVIRSQRFFGGVVFQPRLEAALLELVRSEDFKSVILFNAYGEIVCSAGDIDISDLDSLIEAGEKWDKNSVWMVSLVDLEVESPLEDWDTPTLILQENDRGILHRMRPPPPEMEAFEDNEPRPLPPEPADSNIESATRAGDHVRRERNRPGPRIRRPRGMDEEEYQSLVQKAGLHGFAIEMSTKQYDLAIKKDVWLRIPIVASTLVALLGFGLAWRSLVRSSDLQVRLVRANEMNVHLRRMNLAAAGLAHETRNPLNLVRGLAQVIARDTGTRPETQTQALQITEEVDQITAQLNEFINYSKPCEPKPTPVNLAAVTREVEQALLSDLGDKKIDLKVEIPDTTIEADESFFRQVLFNLLLNAIQSVDEGGLIRIRFGQEKGQKPFLEIRDNGPGVPVENQSKIFQPYFTTREHGTGLGLAVVSQIVLAHGWEIRYVPTEEPGAVFRIFGFNVLSKGNPE